MILARRAAPLRQRSRLLETDNRRLNLKGKRIRKRKSLAVLIFMARLATYTY
jgi:hypothetical protein